MNLWLGVNQNIFLPHTSSYQYSSGSIWMGKNGDDDEDERRPVWNGRGGYCFYWINNRIPKCRHPTRYVQGYRIAANLSDILLRRPMLPVWCIFKIWSESKHSHTAEICRPSPPDRNGKYCAPNRIRAKSETQIWIIQLWMEERKAAQKAYGNWQSIQSWKTGGCGTNW